MVIQQNKIKVFIPHRWSYEDYAKIYELLDRTKYEISDTCSASIMLALFFFLWRVCYNFTYMNFF